MLLCARAFATQRSQNHRLGIFAGANLVVRDLLWQNFAMPFSDALAECSDFFRPKLVR